MFIGVAIIVIAPMLQASNKSQRQYSFYNRGAGPSLRGTAAAAASLLSPKISMHYQEQG